MDGKIFSLASFRRSPGHLVTPTYPFPPNYRPLFPASCPLIQFVRHSLPALRYAIDSPRNPEPTPPTQPSCRPDIEPRPSIGAPYTVRMMIQKSRCALRSRLRFPGEVQLRSLPNHLSRPPTSQSSLSCGNADQIVPTACLGIARLSPHLELLGSRADQTAIHHELHSPW